MQALERDLNILGTKLLYFAANETKQALLRLVAETQASAVCFNHLYDPISMVRDNEVKLALISNGVQCKSFNSDLLYEPWEVVDSDGKALTCFEDFWERVVSLPVPPAVPLPIPAAIPPVPPDIVSLELKDIGIMTAEEELSNQQLEHSWAPGSAGAHKVLQNFVVGRLQYFEHDRAKTDRESTSKLSPHIHYGEISPRHIYYVVKQKEWEWQQQGSTWTSAADFLKQLGYREYSRYLSFHYPFTHERSLLEHLRACPFRFDMGLFKAWRQGRTGYPLVDAGMRQLWSTGWMHNRLRVVCASFLVKNLLLPWQWGLKHYWDALLDADLECDALGWQYVAGCLADAHPFSYMLDPVDKEAKRFDPDGNFVRRWLPSLSRVPAKYIHCPWNAPDHVLEDAGVELGDNYPLPIILPDDSRSQVQFACTVIEQSLSSKTEAAASARLPFRPASKAGASSMWTPGTSMQQGVHLESNGVRPWTAGDRVPGPRQLAAAPPAMLRAAVAAASDGDDSDEEVVSNTVGNSMCFADDKSEMDNGDVPSASYFHGARRAYHQGNHSVPRFSSGGMETSSQGQSNQLLVPECDGTDSECVPQHKRPRIEQPAQR